MEEDSGWYSVLLASITPPARTSSAFERSPVLHLILEHAHARDVVALSGASRALWCASNDDATWARLFLRAYGYAVPRRSAPHARVAFDRARAATSSPAQVRGGVAAAARRVAARRARDFG